MSIEENKAVVRRYQEAYDTNQLDILDEVLAPDFVGHAPTYPGMPEGIERARQAHRLNLALFPDMQVRVEDIIAEGDRVVVRFRQSGTHTGVPMFGAPASGRHFDVGGISIFRIAGGKIVEHWAVEDELGLMRQLGFLPPGQTGNES